MKAENVLRSVSPSHVEHDVRIINLGLTDYLETVLAMQNFTSSRSAQTPDEIWVTQHPPIYTLGLSCKLDDYPLAQSGIPLVKTDRGGKITYHGPGQIVVYLLLDLMRRMLTVRDVVMLMEFAVIDLLAEYRVVAAGNRKAPGVYVNEAKIAALGLRVKRGYCYHGLSLNVDMDLGPFAVIDPCGYPGLKVIQTRDLGIPSDVEKISSQLMGYLVKRLSKLSSRRLSK